MILKMPHQQVGEVNLVDEMVDRLLDILADKLTERLTQRTVHCKRACRAVRGIMRHDSQQDGCRRVWRTR